MLNDGWATHPSFVSEDSVLMAHKNLYEEALHRTEEERQEDNPRRPLARSASGTIIGCSEPHAHVVSSGHHVPDGGQEGAHSKGIRRADRAITETQMACRTASWRRFMRGRARHQHVLNRGNADVLCNAIKLAFSYLLRLSGAQVHLVVGQKSWLRLGSNFMTGKRPPCKSIRNGKYPAEPNVLIC